MKEFKEVREVSRAIGETRREFPQYFRRATPNHPMVTNLHHSATDLVAMRPKLRLRANKAKSGGKSSVSDPDSEAFWIRIRNLSQDPGASF